MKKKRKKPLYNIAIHGAASSPLDQRLQFSINVFRLLIYWDLYKHHFTSKIDRNCNANNVCLGKKMKRLTRCVLRGECVFLCVCVCEREREREGYLVPLLVKG